MPVRDLLFALVACAQAESGQESVRVPPTWAQRPVESTEDATRAPHPLFATVAGIRGRVRLDCLVLETGLADDCRVAAVAPAGLGFEDVALGRTSQLRFNPGTQDGRAVQSRVRFVVDFPAEEEAPEVDPSAWPRPSDTALAMMRPFAKAIVERGDDLKESWEVDPDRSHFVALLVADVNREMRVERIEALTFAMARTLTEQEARQAAAATDPWSPAIIDKIFAAAPEDQMQSRSFMRTIHGRYCAAYDCSSALPED